MKKLITKILSLALTVILSIGILSGCELITTDMELDMNQVVATIELEGMEKESITKGQLVSSFNSNGYLYVYYYGYTQKQAYEETLKSLVNNAIIVQQAKQALTTGTTFLKNDKGYFETATLVPEAERTSKDNVLLTVNYNGQPMTTVSKNDAIVNFLTKYEYLKANYEVLVSIDSLIDEYVTKEEEEEETKENETFSITDRTTLTIATEQTGNEYEILKDAELSKITEDFKNSYKKVVEELGLDLTSKTTKYDYEVAIFEEYINKFDLTSRDRKKAVNKVIKLLNKNGLITSEEASKDYEERDEVGELLNISYFKNMLDSAYKAAIVEKLELALENQEEKKIDNVKKLYAEYESLYETQKAEFFNDYQAYENALSSASKSSFVVYNPNFGGNYGYISNLLIGFNAEQTAALENFTEKEIGEKNKFRDTLLEDLTVKDMRTSWVMQNYGKFDNGTFTFGENYCKTPALQNFNGVLSGATPYTEKDSYGEDVTKYNFKSVQANEVKFTDFYTNVVSSLMGFTGLSGKLENVSETNAVSQNIKEDVLVKFRDLIYAYSTDPGSLAENYGYVYSPITSKTTYVEEYAEAAKELVEGGVGSYKVVATEYGYHIMLCTSVVTPTTDKLGFDAFKNDVNKEGTLAYNFKEYKYKLISTTTITNITNSAINNYNKNESVVSYNLSAYKDLLVE